MGNKKILLVDTDVKFLDSLKEYLEGSGIDVEIVMDGNAALEKVNDDFDAVITGVVIPKMDGLKLSERIYNLTMGKTPVIIVSGIYKGVAIRNKAIHSGKAVAFIEKPFSKEVIRKVLEEKANFDFKIDKEETKHKEDDNFETRIFEEKEPKKEQKPPVVEPRETKDNEKVSSEILFGDILEELNEDEELKVEELEEEITPIEEPEEDIIELNETDEVNENKKKELKDEDDIQNQIDKEKSKKILNSSSDSDIDALISSITNYEKSKPKERRTNIDSDDIDELISKTLVDLKIKKKKINEIEDLSPEQKRKQLEEIEKKIEEKQKSIEAEQKKSNKDKQDTKEKSKAVKPEVKAEGKYQLIEKIATGGMAEIYKAKQRGAVGFEKIVTIKKILPHLADDEEFIEMFIDEAKIAASLSHPNIVQIFDLGKMDNEFIIAMEYIAGIDLGTINKKLRKSKRHFPVEIPLYITLKVSEALDYAHKKKNHYGQPMGIVHRDVNPNNILVSFEGEVKLVDFGISKARVKLHHTIAGGLKGKYIYMSPEQASGKEVDLRTDIFALGILLYETLTLKNPFISFSEPAILEKVKKVEYEDPRKLNHSISEEIVKIIDKCMQKNPDKRYQNAKELRNDIEKVLIKEVTNIAILKDLLSKFVAKNFPDETRKAGFTIDDTIELVKRKDEIDKIISEKTKKEKRVSEAKVEGDEIVIELTEEDEIESNKKSLSEKNVKKEKDYKKEEKIENKKIDAGKQKEKEGQNERKIRNTKTYEDIIEEQKKEKEKMMLEKEIAITIKKEKSHFSRFLIVFLMLAILGAGGYFAYQKFFSTVLPNKNHNNIVIPPKPEEMSRQTDNQDNSSSTDQQEQTITQDQTIDNNTISEKDVNTQSQNQQGQNTSVNNKKNKTQINNTINSIQQNNYDNINKINKKTIATISPSNKNKEPIRNTKQQQSKPKINKTQNNNVIAQNNNIITQNNDSQNTKLTDSKQNKKVIQGQDSQSANDNNKNNTNVIQNIQNNKPTVQKPEPKPKPKKIIQKQPIIKEGDVVAYPQLDSPIKVLKQVSPSLTYGETRLGAIRVIMQVLVNTNGKAETFRIIRIIPKIAGLDSKMKKVIKDWRFSIPKKNGIKVKSWKTVSLLIKK